MNPESQNQAQMPPPPAGKKNFKKFLWPLAVLVLLVVIIVMVLLWKPWQPTVKVGERTISVSGQATVKAAPDEFVFGPSYDFTNADKQAALSALTAKNNEIVSKLKALGVADKDIANSSSGYNTGIYYPVQASNGSFTYTLSLTITIDNKTLAQKVQDYLVSTGPTGEVSPQANFSQAKQKQLQNQARGQAETDARANAEQSAKNLGFTLDRVKSVDDSGFDNGGGCGKGFLCPLTLNAQASTNKSLSIQPGENDLSYSVTVVYYIH